MNYKQLILGVGLVSFGCGTAFAVDNNKIPIKLGDSDTRMDNSPECMVSFGYNGVTYDNIVVMGVNGKCRILISSPKKDPSHLVTLEVSVMLKSGREVGTVSITDVQGYSVPKGPFCFLDLGSSAQKNYGYTAAPDVPACSSVMLDLTY